MYTQKNNMEIKIENQYQVKKGVKEKLTFCGKQLMWYASMGKKEAKTQFTLYTQMHLRYSKDLNIK